MVKNLSARERILVSFFLITLLVSVSFRFLLFPVYKDYLGARDELEQLEFKNSPQALDSGVVGEAQALDKDKKRWKAILAKYPRGSAGGNFISELGRMSAGNNVIIKNIQAFPPGLDSGIGIQPYRIELLGSYDKIIAVIKTLEKGIFCINIKNVKLVPVEGEGDPDIDTVDKQTYNNELSGAGGNLLTGPVLARLNLDVYNLPQD